MREWLTPKPKPVEERLGKILSTRKFPIPTIKFQFEDSTTKRLKISEELLPHLEPNQLGRIVFQGRNFKQFKRFT